MGASTVTLHREAGQLGRHCHVSSLPMWKGCKQAAGDEGRLKRLSAWQKTEGSRARA